MSKKNGSSVIPAKNWMPVGSWVVMVRGGASAATDEIVVGAVKLRIGAWSGPVATEMVAICGVVRKICGLNPTKANRSA